MMVQWRYDYFHMIAFNRHFKPSWSMTLISLSSIALFIALGLWQLDRAAYKHSIVDRFKARLSAGFKPFERVEDWPLNEYRRVILKGKYDIHRTLLLDNQLSRGEAGYHVLSPFELTDGGLVLVNRGWIPMGKSRLQLPTIEPPKAPNEAKGIMVMPDTEGFRLGKVTIAGQWPQVIPFIDIAALQSAFDNRLLPVVVWLSPEHEGYYERNWQPVWLAPERSEAYAVQWFLFAAITLLLFFILNLRKLDE